MGFILSLLIAILAAVVISVLELAALLGVMYVLHHKLPDVLGDNEYGEFSFEHFTQTALMQLLKKLGLIVGVPTIFLFVIVYLLESLYVVPRTTMWDVILGAVMFVGHFGLVFLGFRKLMEFEPKKAAILTATVTVAFVVIYLVLVPSNLLY